MTRWVVGERDFGQPAKEPQISGRKGLIASLALALLCLAGVSSHASPTTPIFKDGTMLGTYEVTEVARISEDGVADSLCAEENEDSNRSEHCGKQVWVVAYGNSQVAVLEKPNQKLRPMTRLRAFDLRGELFCFGECAWRAEQVYGELKNQLFTSNFARGFLLSEEITKMFPLLNSEGAHNDVYFFHEGLVLASSATLAPDYLGAVATAIGSLTKGLNYSAPIWRVLLPKDTLKQSPVVAPEEIRIHETHSISLWLTAEITHVQYTLVRKP